MNPQELTLLHLFDAIMTEGSITRAADRLAMTQPAVSNAVARMRERWQDPLFVKKGRSIEPTSFALNLWEQVRAPMHDLASALDASHFEPATSRRQFRIALGDAMLDLCWLPLVKQLALQAPNVDLYSLPFTLKGAITQLREANVDLAIGPLDYHDRSLRSVPLFESHYRLAMRADHALAQRAITLDEFVAARHLRVTTSGDASGTVDRALEQLGFARRVAVTVNHFSAVPKLLLQTDLIAVLPQIVAGATEFASQLWLTAPPFDVPPTPIYLIWHTRHDRDPGLLWLRKLIEQIVAQQCDLCGNCAAPVY